MASTEHEMDQLRKEIEQLRGDVLKVVDALKDLGTAQGRVAVERARATGRSIKEEAEQLRSEADRHIEERPLTSVLMSFGIGCVIGMLLDRRH